MIRRMFAALTLFALGVAYQATVEAKAVPLSQASGLAQAIDAKSSVIKVDEEYDYRYRYNNAYGYGHGSGYAYRYGYPRYERARRGCGWDYPCEPRRSYGKRYFSGGNSQVYIKNNYGTVNVYSNGARRSHRGYYRPYRWRDRYDESSYRCRDRGCGDDCGVFCWYKRVRSGYCGHGCDTYRERVRYETGYRTVEYPRPYFYRHRPRYDDYGSTRFERPYDDDRVPLRRFDGPRY
ncbi:hypothetical protein Rvan_2167 [Rhodomicrobium vannielii ATCC 17100]|uniref:Uncharacterized protein n=1 Tax=Rhodomicrobium vannielii (strain ATCC 17100 / DSM 162 / LMG 4299 / NCIMB 10020 / ATH 3.1.1) TaxID=648757 RepID=E3I2N3_RHOVT|nr:hypothetical protein [Rhodomicrobium vannielii]ADP71392.1 hypothetical protein Rvan_2167 [Rhodomicrobium vannielii ATCC 17100]